MKLKIIRLLIFLLMFFVIINVSIQTYDLEPTIGEYGSINDKQVRINPTRYLNLENELIYPTSFDPDSFHNIPKGYFEREVDSIHPVNAAYYALYNYEKWKDSDYSEDLYKDEFLSASNAIRHHLEYSNIDNEYEVAVLLYDFDWDYAGELIKSPWVSGMAQGMAISVLLREYDITKDEIILRDIKALVNSLTKNSIYFNDLVTVSENGYWIEEYPPLKNDYKETRSSVLNGGLLGAYGLIEYYEYTKNPEVYDVVEKIKNKIIIDISKYDFDGNEPTYGLLNYSELKDKLHVINIESDVTPIHNTELPVYEMSITTNNSDPDHKVSEEILRVMRTTGGSKNYEFEEFYKGNEINFLLSSDSSYKDNKALYVVNLYLKDSDGRIVGNTRADENKFYGIHWSAPEQTNGYYVRRFYPGQDPYKGVNETGHFKIVLEEDVKPDKDLFLEVEYIKLTENPINIYMYNQGRFNLGYLKDKVDETIHREKYYIPRTKDFSAYSFYMGWGNVETIEGSIPVKKINEL